MKLQINTTEKTIKIEESVNLKELFETIDKLFPNLEWKAYKLEQTVINNWGSPIIIQPYEPFQAPLYPWNLPIIYGNQQNNPYYISGDINLSSNGTDSGKSNISTLTDGNTTTDTFTIQKSNHVYNVQV